MKETEKIPRSGYILPVFAAASAVAAIKCLRENFQAENVTIDLIEPNIKVNIPIQQIVKLNNNQAVAITISDPGDNLDLTRNTPVWAVVEYKKIESKKEDLTIIGGEGIGKSKDGKISISRYAQQLLEFNLKPYLILGKSLEVTIVLPEGRKLAKRTSNEAFGVVEGLSLLGTTGISQPISTAGQLALYQQELELKAKKFKQLVFCIGENGLDFAQKLGIDAERLIKTGNWLGSLLVTAALADLESVLLLGYHGKLIKLAGGIFHTHHHLADGRLETLVAIAAQFGLPTMILQQLYQCPTTEEALQLIRDLDSKQGSQWEKEIYQAIALKIDQRSQEYIRKHTEKPLQIGSILFDRKRNLIAKSLIGKELLTQIVSYI